MTHRGKLITGIILIFLGLAFLGQVLGLIDASLGDLFRGLLPLLLIAAGFWLIARKKRQEAYRQAGSHPHSQGIQTNHVQERPSTGSDSGGTPPPGVAAHEFYSSSNYEETRVSEIPIRGLDGKLQYSKTFGDLSIDLSGERVQNIEISMVFGDLDLRMHEAVFADGLNRVIISGFIGDIRIMVSNKTAIFAHCSSFIGDIETMGRKTDGFGNNVDAQTPTYPEADQKVYIAANSFLGDIRIYQV